MGKLKLQRKCESFNPNKQIDFLLNTTNIVGYCETADKINCFICNMLPTTQGKFMISHSIDTINKWRSLEYKLNINLPSSVCLQQGAKVMYLSS